jgi:hypothetical protein
MLCIVVGSCTSWLVCSVNVGTKYVYNRDIIVHITTAIRDQGILLYFFEKYFSRIIIVIKDIDPIMKICILIDERACKENHVLHIIVGNCFIISVIPIAASIHLITVVGIYLLILLAHVTHIIICNIHATTTAAKNASNHILLTDETIIATSHAAGPLTLNIELLHNPIIIHHIIPATSQLISGTPLATAIHKHNGTATKKTANQAGRSLFRVLNIGTIRHKK